MNEHFIKNIEIEKFKCFKNFKAEGFSRVNLITGKNNVGKTAFMEACFLLASAFNIFKEHNYTENKGAGIDRPWFHFELIKLLLEVQQNREKTSFILPWLKEELKINIDNFEIAINKKFRLHLQGTALVPEHFGTSAWGNWGYIDIANFRKHKGYDKIYTKNHLPVIKHQGFVSICDNSKRLHDMIGDLKINNQIEEINNILDEMFNFDTIDVIKDSIMLRNTGKFINFSELGDGTKHFVNMIIVLSSNKNTTIYLDEIDNGIHHSKLDELWEVILKTSKQLNVQVFATTHSKECIESYARVAKKLQDAEIALIELGKKDKNIDSIVFDYNGIMHHIEQKLEVRGW